MVTSSPQQSTGPDAATKSKELAAKSGQKSDASKKPTGSKASLVKSNTNEGNGWFFSVNILIIV